MGVTSIRVGRTFWNCKLGITKRILFKIRLLKNFIVKICKIASIVRFNTTKTDQELIFQQLYFIKISSDFTKGLSKQSFLTQFPSQSIRKHSQRIIRINPCLMIVAPDQIDCVSSNFIN